MMISALLINLDRSAERLLFQTEQLEKLGIPFERLPAADARTLTDEEYHRLAYDWERPLSRAEAACFLSHFHAWELVAKQDRPSLILEDDVLLSKHTPGLLSALAGYQGPARHISLETRNRKKLLGMSCYPVDAYFSLRRLYQDRTGAAAYILFPEGARLLLHEAKTRGAALADAFLCRSYGLRSLQVVPAAAVQSDQSRVYSLDAQKIFASTISVTAPQAGSSAGAGAAMQGNTPSARRFKARRIWAQVRMGIRFVSCCYKARRCLVEPDRPGFEDMSK